MNELRHLPLRTLKREYRKNFRMYGKLRKDLLFIAAGKYREGMKRIAEEIDRREANKNPCTCGFC